MSYLTNIILVDFKYLKPLLFIILKISTGDRLEAPLTT